MGLDILDGNPSAGGFGNPQSLRIRIPKFFFENMDSRIPQLKDSGNPDFYGIGRWSQNSAKSNIRSLCYAWSTMMACPVRPILQMRTWPMQMAIDYSISTPLPSLQNPSKRFFLGCVIPRPDVGANKRNLGKPSFRSSVGPKTLKGSAPHSQVRSAPRFSHLNLSLDQTEVTLANKTARASK